MADDSTTEGTDDATLASLLADESMWAEPPAGEADALVAAISGDNVVEFRRSPKAAAITAAVSAAAALVLIAVLVTRGPDDPDGLIVALAGTGEAPAASADAVVVDTPLGTRIDLDVTGLDPAPDGFYYEAWLRKDATIGISAGTFHMRGGDGEIELWSGVTVADYPLITITLQREDGGTEPSGVVVLRGTAG